MLREERLEQVRAYILSHIGSCGRAPSYRQIARRFDIRSLSTVHSYIRRLVALGRLEEDMLRTKRPPDIRRADLCAPGAYHLSLPLAGGSVLQLDCEVRSTDSDHRLSCTASGFVDFPSNRVNI